jgi:formamidopyrimidine-DNA glycosylase
MRRYLGATSLHHEIAELTFQSAGYLLGDDPGPHRDEVCRLKGGLEGRSFEETGRHGKWMFVWLSGDGHQALGLHFGMTGGLKYFRDTADEPAYDRVRFDFANGYHLAYISMRKLGAVRLIDDVDGFIERKDLGPDALAEELDFDGFRRLLQDRRRMIKALFLDQHVLAGLGNVYADEILYQASIHPRTRAHELNDKDLRALFEEMHEVLETAIARQAQPGDFPESYLTVHRHEDGICPRCGAELERVKVSSRTAYACPNCQDRPTGETRER